MSTSEKKSAIRHAVFLGSKKLGLGVLKSVIRHSENMKWTIIHPNDSGDARNAFKDFQDFASASGLDMLVPSAALTTKQILRDLKADIGLVCGWYTLLDHETLSYVPHGLWGVHNSLLPKYRGGSPLIWSIIQGDPFVGCSLFKISEGMDDGEILHQVKVENKLEDDVQSILTKMEIRLVAELPEKWNELISGKARLVSQIESEATFCGQRIARDGLIDWRQPAEAVHNFIKAQAPPYPCAFSFLFEDKILFLKSKPNAVSYLGTPGQILKRNKDSVLISCGNGTSIEIFKIQVNDQDVSPADFLRSLKFRLSDAPTIASSN